MRFFYLLVFIFLLSVDAQRRSVKSELLSENEPSPKSARRGRARFTASSEAPQIEEQKRSEPVGRRFASRRRPEIHTEASPVRKGYEVDEIVDDTPIETFRRTSKSKVLTETKYEAHNAPPSNTLFQPVTTENLEEVIKSIGSDILDTTSSSVLSSSTFPTSLDPSLSDITSGEITKIDNEITRTQLETTTPLSTRASKRNNGRSRTNTVVNTPTVGSRGRSRTRPASRPEEPTSSQPPTRTFSRGSRRRLEPVSAETRGRTSMASAESVQEPVRSRNSESRRRGPSVIASAETVELPTRSRNGRRIPNAARKTEESKLPERIPINLPHSSRSGGRRTADAPLPTTTPTTIRSRSRSRFRETPPVIDEQKLEVLPLFENEPKTVRPARKFVARRRSFNSAEEVETSATENDVKVAPKPPKQSVVVETRTESTIRRRKSTKPTNHPNSRTNKPTVQTTKPTIITTRPTVKSTKLTTLTTRPTAKSTKLTTLTTRPTVKSTKPTLQATRPTIHSSRPTVQATKSTTQGTKSTLKTSRPVVKESVISEITEVTSKRTVTRNKLGRNKIELPKPATRGSKKSEVNLLNVKKTKSSLTSSEEEIDDTDNYPEPFKALIQAKKQKKESRPPQRLVTASPAVTKTTEKVVNSSPSTTTQIISSEANRQHEDSENELDPVKPVRPTRPVRRFTQTTEKATRPTRKNKFARSTTIVPLSTTEHRFHAKFNNEPEASSSSPVKSSRSFSPKPPRGLYSSRKTKESYTKNKSTTAQIPILKKSNRYSARYRNDASSRGAIRTSTNAPAYLPTIPTITPPTTSEYVWPEEENIEYSWSFSRLN